MESVVPPSASLRPSAEWGAALRRVFRYEAEASLYLEANATATARTTARASASANANAGVSPLRCAPVEMTMWVRIHVYFPTRDDEAVMNEAPGRFSWVGVRTSSSRCKCGVSPLRCASVEMTRRVGERGIHVYFPTCDDEAVTNGAPRAFWVGQSANKQQQRPVQMWESLHCPFDSLCSLMVRSRGWPFWESNPLEC